MQNHTWGGRWLAAAGLAGAATMFVGDMLFYGQWGAGREALSETFALVAAAPAERLMAGGFMAPLAGIGLLFGVGYVFRQLALAPRVFRAVTIFCLLAVVIVAVATHAVWGAFALAATTGEALAIMRVNQYLQMHFLIGAGAAIPAAILLFIATVAGLSRWPRWMVFFNPGLLYLLMVGGAWIPAPLGAAVVGGAFNLAFAVFFAASLAAPDRTANQRVGAAAALA